MLCLRPPSIEILDVHHQAPGPHACASSTLATNLSFEVLRAVRGGFDWELFMSKSSFFKKKLKFVFVVSYYYENKG